MVRHSTKQLAHGDSTDPNAIAMARSSTGPASSARLRREHLAADDEA
jgi:hypothetical protein